MSEENNMVHEDFSSIVDIIEQSLIKNLPEIKDDVYAEIVSEGDRTFPLTTTIISNINLELSLSKMCKIYEFMYSHRVFQTFTDPSCIFQTIFPKSKYGFISVPSPMIEILRGVEDKQYCGYRKSRYIIWVQYNTNTIYILPKYPIIETLSIDNNLYNYCLYCANTSPHLWNQYIYWCPEMTPNIYVYEEGLNFTMDEYKQILEGAVNDSIQSSHQFLFHIQESHINRIDNNILKADDA